MIHRQLSTNRQPVQIALNINGYRVIGRGPLPEERRLFKMHWAHETDVTLSYDTLCQCAGVNGLLYVEQQLHA